MLYQLSYSRLTSTLSATRNTSAHSLPLSIRSEPGKPDTTVVGVIGFEPIQSKTPDLQSGPALQLRRTPDFKNAGNEHSRRN